jgi:hypothetical protein
MSFSDSLVFTYSLSTPAEAEALAAAKDAAKATAAAEKAAAKAGV